MFRSGLDVCRAGVREHGCQFGLLPTKGLTLPFVSYGGNSLIVNCVLLGMVLRTAAHWSLSGHSRHTQAGESVSVHSASYRALIAAGGTGGHVYPALAVAAYLVELGWSVDWVGTEQGIEHRLSPLLDCLCIVSRCRVFEVKADQEGDESASPVFAVLESCALIRRLNRMSCWGWVVMQRTRGLAAFLSRRPLVIHEQNAVAGTTNRWLSPIAARVLCGLPGPFAEARTAEVVGNPVRDVFRRVDRQELQTLASFSAARPMRILILGGSLGSAPLNELLPATASVLASKGYCDKISVWHQCGERNRLSAELAWEKQPLGNLRLDAYIDDMATAYDWADVVISRAGALTVSELAANRHRGDSDTAAPCN